MMHQSSKFNLTNRCKSLSFHVLMQVIEVYVLGVKKGGQPGREDFSVDVHAGPELDSDQL